MKASGFKTKKKTRTQSDCLREVISMWLIIKANYGSGILTTIPISYKQDNRITGESVTNVMNTEYGENNNLLTFMKKLCLPTS